MHHSPNSRLHKLTVDFEVKGLVAARDIVAPTHHILPCVRHVQGIKVDCLRHHGDTGASGDGLVVQHPLEVGGDGRIGDETHCHVDLRAIVSRQKGDAVVDWPIYVQSRQGKKHITKCAIHNDISESTTQLHKPTLIIGAFRHNSCYLGGRRGEVMGEPMLELSHHQEIEQAK